MPAPKFVTNFVQYMFDTYSKDGGKLLVHLGALGWVFSSAAQLTMLAADKKIDKKKKKFLLPQEAADAAVNVMMYYSICEIIKRGADKLVESGKLLTDETAAALNKITGSKSSDLNVWKNLFTDAEKKTKLTKLLSEPENLDFFKKLTKSEQTKVLPVIEEALTKLEGHKNNVGTIAAIAASVLACNLVTPYVRNKAASKYQKSLLRKEAVSIRKTQIKENITMKNPLPTSFKSFNSYNSFGNIKI